MKEKNLPDDNDFKSLEKLTQEINNIIEKKFQKKSKSIKQDMKEKIKSITNKKNAK